MSGNTHMNRRRWLRSAGLIGAGLSTAPALFGKHWLKSLKLGMKEYVAGKKPWLLLQKWKH